MDILEEICNSRSNNGFVIKNYKKYYEHCRSKLREIRKMKDSLRRQILMEIYILERNLCKAFLFLEKPRKSRKNIKKCIKNIEKNKFEINDKKILKKYYFSLLDMNMLQYSKGLEKLISLRSLLDPRYTILFDNVDELIEICAVKADLKDKIPNSYVCKWNDIEIKFKNEKEFKSFENNELKIRTESYNYVLISKIMELNLSEQRLLKKMDKKNGKLKNVYEKIKKYFNSISDLKIFLKKNYVNSEYLESLSSDANQLLKIYENLVKCRTPGITFKSEENILPERYKDLKNFVDFSISKADIGFSESIKYLEEMVNGYFEPRSQYENVPFLPVFYDNAYDYIVYPKPENDLALISELKNTENEIYKK
ncbi:hypothetical protein CWI38_2069p0020 [Hamiltosporidium tvaerminnensis]|uniref:Signal recognition particle subunit SRP68 n=1 Tax=Hamiltosporidium tvaerminnensis TaxID=1176355 RepID=A0A4Q9LRA8_9MICR|nr:hypothetical protein LUQ84_3540 [Hamiltosporidium tvaerminnensis]TBT98426.1 hypothetical protein CWI37_1761p0020 [Hamiltosporidium tvaerminnensis]TBU10045.1 hypothetical protein CWI38_2069p0020 [Hamiltosporidium tvaerminnensis]